MLTLKRIYLYSVLGIALAVMLLGIQKYPQAPSVRRVYDDAVDYMRLRLLGAPAVLITLAAFGILRGRQDMTSPLKIAVGLNLLNIVLDAVLIFGLGPLPAIPFEVVKPLLPAEK